MTLIGLHVTQYMYVLFDKVHIYIQRSQFTLARYVQKCVVSNKHPVKVQRATNYRNTHDKTLINDTSVKHTDKDKLLLNALKGITYL